MTEALAPAIDERTVVAIWERQSFDPAGLEALGLRVVYRGVPADAGGPDYQGAILSQANRAILSGDIEFHVQSSDWYRHGHHLNPAYNRVILHVVWQDDCAPVQREDGGSVPAVALSLHADLQIAASPPRTLLAHPCISRFSRLSPQDLAAGIEAAGWTRFDGRTAQFAADMEVLTPDQVAYAGLLESLGYASNREAFRDLALRVPYGWLMTVPPEERCQTLLDGAGLGPPASFPAPAHLPPDAWRLARLRPANHPVLRLAGIVHIVNRATRGLSQYLVDAALTAKSSSQLREAIIAPGDRANTIGKGRADEMIASMVLPFVAAQCPDSARPRALFGTFPSPPATKWTRHMCSLFTTAGHNYRPRTALQHQGLHHQYHAHCRTERAAGCALCGNARK